MPSNGGKAGIVLGLAVLLIALLVGCGQAEPTDEPAPGTSAPAPEAFDLDGTEWILAKLSGADLLPGTQITAGFADGRAAGFASCNAYGGPYVADDGALSISMLEVTAQACIEPQGVMEQEGAYLAALQEAAAYRVTGDQLELEDGKGTRLLVFARKERARMDPAQLLGTGWQLVSLNGARPVEGSTITLAFLDDSNAIGMAGCREYDATYEASEDDIHFLSLSMSGDDACLADEALYRQEGDYTDALTWATNYRLGERQLEIETARGEVLVFGLSDGEPVLSPEQGAAGRDACAEYLDLVVSAPEGEHQTVVTSYQCGGAHIDSTGQSPDLSSHTVPVDARLQLDFWTDKQPDSVVARIYAKPGVSASFFRWPEELPGGAEPVAVFDEITDQSLVLEPQLPPGEYSMVIRAAWAGDVEVFYAFSFKIG
jgi:heat shock protein HslJ